MKLIHRIGYYSLGLAIGLVFLAFFLKGKDASCDYSPNARVKKNIRTKEKILSEKVQTLLDNKQIDTSYIRYILHEGSVDFSESNTNLDVCNIYVITAEKDGKNLLMKVENCPEKAIILALDEK